VAFPPPNDANENFDAEGKAALLPQYDDVTIRRMEVINAKNNLRVWLMANYVGIADVLMEFNIYFGGLYDSTCLEVKEKSNAMSDELSKRIDTFLYSTYDPNDNQKVKDLSNEALYLHNEYEKALLKAGFRKLIFMSLKPEKGWTRMT